MQDTILFRRVILSKYTFQVLTYMFSYKNCGYYLWRWQCQNAINHLRYCGGDFPSQMIVRSHSDESRNTQEGKHLSGQELKSLERENEYSRSEKAKRMLACVVFLVVNRSEPFPYWRKSNINTWLSCWCTHEYFGSMQLHNGHVVNCPDRATWLLELSCRDIYHYP